MTPHPVPTSGPDAQPVASQIPPSQDYSPKVGQCLSIYLPQEPSEDVRSLESSKVSARPRTYNPRCVPAPGTRLAMYCVSRGQPCSTHACRHAPRRRPPILQEFSRRGGHGWWRRHERMGAASHQHDVGTLRLVQQDAGSRESQRNVLVRQSVGRVVALLVGLEPATRSGARFSVSRLLHAVLDRWSRRRKVHPCRSVLSYPNGAEAVESDAGPFMR
jgi:hypothetical protein